MRDRVVLMRCVEPIEARERRRQFHQVLTRQLQRTLTRMISRTLSVGVAGHVPFDVTAEDVSERASPQKADYTSGAFLISVGVFNCKSPSHKQVAANRSRYSFLHKN